MVDKINTISKFKGYVQSALLSHAHKLCTPLLNSHINSRLSSVAGRYQPSFRSTVPVCMTQFL